MNDELEQKARHEADAAWTDWCDEGNDTLWMELHPKEMWKAGYLAARSVAADAWIPINSIEDLPKQSGLYWWSPRLEGEGQYVRQLYWHVDTMQNLQSPTQFVHFYSAYMKVNEPAPYQPQEAEEGK